MANNSPIDDNPEEHDRLAKAATIALLQQLGLAFDAIKRNDINANHRHALLAQGHARTADLHRNHARLLRKGGTNQDFLSRMRGGRTFVSSYGARG